MRGKTTVSESEWGDPLPAGDGDASTVRAALAKLCASAQFAQSHQLQRLLEFTVERTLAGRSDEIKEYTIAVEVLGRDASHDTNIDPIVRTEARRLRRKLEEYYLSDGLKESLRINYPKGSYVPVFLRSSHVEGASQRLPRRAVVAGLAGLAGLGILVGGAFVWKNLQTSNPKTNARTHQASRIAVLPFDDFTPGVPDPSLTYAITDSLNTRLANLDGLSVASRTSVARAKERNLELHEIASLLQTDYIVEGSVIRSGNDCRVSVQLVRAQDDRQIWAEAFEVPWSDILTVTADVSESVARALDIALGTDAADESVTSARLEVAESYARGQYYLLQFQARRLRPHASEAQRYLQKTLVLEPEHVDAMVALSELSFWQLYPPQGDREELLARTERYSKQALSNNPNQASALSLLSSVAAERGDRDEALRLSRRALLLAPRDPRINAQMGARFRERGFYETALIHYNAALEFDPLEISAYGPRYWLLGNIGRHDDAFETHEAVRRIESDGPTVDLILGESYFLAGNLAQARAVWTRGRESAIPDADTSYLEIALGVVDALEGNENEARRVASLHRGSAPRTRDHLIQLFALVGETELALHHIEQSPFCANYRWLVTTPTLHHLLRAPGIRGVLDELYLQWQVDIVELGAASSVPELPTPEEVLRQVASESLSTEP